MGLKVFTTPSVPLQGTETFLRGKEGSTSHLGLLPSVKKRETALQFSEPLRSKVGGVSKPSPCCAGPGDIDIWVNKCYKYSI